MGRFETRWLTGGKEFIRGIRDIMFDTRPVQDDATSKAGCDVKVPLVPTISLTALTNPYLS
jgi:hypothetical protein